MKTTVPSRRSVLAHGLLLGSAAVLEVPASAAKSRSTLLRPTAVEGPIRVRMEMVVKGNVHLAKNPLVDRNVDLKLPVASDGVFDYEERLHRPTTAPSLGPSGAGDDAIVTYAERYYHEAGCDAKLNKVVTRDRLRPEARSVVIRRESLPEVIYSDDTYLTRDEVELLRCPVSSIAVDYLLPREAVSVGERYFPSIETLAQVFNLTNVLKSDLGVTVESIEDDAAKFEMRGQIDASVDGVPTLIRVNGKMTFDRKRKTCSWLAVAVHETREVGVAEPGFDLTATIKMIRRPLDAPIALPRVKPPVDLTAAIPRGRLMVALGSDAIGFDAMMDRRWRLMSDVAGTAVMRMVDNDRSIAQCDFRPLPALPPGKTWTLGDFVADVKKTLGSQLKDIAEQSQRVSESGVSVLQLVAMGEAGGVPIQWTLLHLTDSSGRRVLATFTMEADKVDDFAGSDLQLAATMRFAQPERAAPIEASEAISSNNPRSATSAESAGPDKSPAETTRVSKNANPKAKKGSQRVQSASDLVR